MLAFSTGESGTLRSIKVSGTQRVLSMRRSDLRVIADDMAGFRCDHGSTENYLNRRIESPIELECTSMLITECAMFPSVITLQTATNGGLVKGLIMTKSVRNKIPHARYVSGELNWWRPVRSGNSLGRTVFIPHRRTAESPTTPMPTRQFSISCVRAPLSRFSFQKQKVGEVERQFNGDFLIAAGDPFERSVLC